MYQAPLLPKLCKMMTKQTLRKISTTAGKREWVSTFITPKVIRNSWETENRWEQIDNRKGENGSTPSFKSKYSLFSRGKVGPTARRTRTRCTGQADVPAPRPVCLAPLLPKPCVCVCVCGPCVCVCVCLVPVNHPWIFWGQLRGHRRFFSSLCRHPGLHTLPALGAGNFEQFPRYRPEDFTRKVSCLGLVKLAKPASFQVLSLREKDCIT